MRPPPPQNAQIEFFEMLPKLQKIEFLSKLVFFAFFGFLPVLTEIKIEFKIAVSPAPALGEMQKPNALGF